MTCSHSVRQIWAKINRNQKDRAAILSNAAVAAVALGLVVGCLVHFGWSARGGIEALFLATLTVLAFADLERRVIPNRIVLPATAIVFVAQIALFSGKTIEWIVSAAAAAGLFLVIALVYPPGMGMGDVKLALLVGAALGRLAALALLVGMAAAAAVGLALIARRGLRARRQALPLAPFLALGSVFAVFFGRW